MYRLKKANWLSGIVITLMLFLNMQAPVFPVSLFLPVTDSIVQPPDSPDTLHGPVENCVNDTTLYYSELPMGCTADWYIDTVLQGSDSGTLEIIWTEAGNYTISLYFNCDSGTFFSDSLQVTVDGTPAIAGNISGDAEVCQNTTHTYSTTVDTGAWCEWWVAGEMQSTTDTFMVYTFGDPGDYLIEVYALNDCGASSQASTLMVTAFDNPVVNLGNDTTIYQGQSITLDADNSGSHYFWSTGDTTQTITVFETGSYSVLVNNACGEDSDTIFVDVIVSILDPGIENQNIIHIRGRRLIIEDQDLQIQQITITDISGKIIYKGNYKKEIPLPGKGIYIVSVKTGNAGFTFKVIVLSQL